MSWVRPDRGIFPDLPHTLANAQLYEAVMVVISQKLSRTCTVLKSILLLQNDLYKTSGGKLILCTNYNFIAKMVDIIGKSMHHVISVFPLNKKVINWKSLLINTLM